MEMGSSYGFACEALKDEDVEPRKQSDSRWVSKKEMLEPLKCYRYGHGEPLRHQQQQQQGLEFGGEGRPQRDPHQQLHRCF